MNPKTSRHLTLEEVRTIHALMIEQHGGTHGERAPHALESALAQPGAAHFGTPLHSTVSEQAGAYLFHLCQAHAFLDGNKRTALFATLTFLQLNGFTLQATDDQFFDLVLQVATGMVHKSALNVILEPWLQPL